jgi:hypothetical protein
LIINKGHLKPALEAVLERRFGPATPLGKLLSEENHKREDQEK